MNGDYMELLMVIIRTVFFYFFITIAYRLMGKREIGQLGIIDLIVSILIAELVAISIENLTDPIYLTIVPISLLVILEIFLAFISTKSKTLRVIFEGKPSLIIAKGVINYHEMVKQRYTLDDLLLSLRQKDIRDISEVEYAFLESNGKLSVFKYKPFKIKSSYPMPLIVDGSIEKDTLNYLRKSEKWLLDMLDNENINLKDIFYGFYNKKRIYFIKKVKTNLLLRNDTLDQH